MGLLTPSSCSVSSVPSNRSSSLISSPLKAAACWPRLISLTSYLILGKYLVKISMESIGSLGQFALKSVYKEEWVCTCVCVWGRGEGRGKDSRMIDYWRGGTGGVQLPLCSILAMERTFFWNSGSFRSWRSTALKMTNLRDAIFPGLQLGIQTKTLERKISCAQWNTVLKSRSSACIALIWAESLRTGTLWKIYISGQIVVTNLTCSSKS